MSKRYEVGYKRPPKETQFKMGQSGNPRGRPKGTKNLKADLEEELCEQIIIREGNTEKTISKQRAFIKIQMTLAIKGNPRAANLMFSMICRLLEIDEMPDEDELSPNEQAILKSFEESILRNARLKADEKNPPVDDSENQNDTNKQKGN